MRISQEGESAVLATPYRKQQHAGPSALELFTAAPNSEVESLAGCSHTFSGNDVVIRKVEEVTTSAKGKKLKLNEEPLPDPFILPDNH